MTALDRQLAKTFRAARWADSGGKPVCEKCFDGLDLDKPTPDPLTPGLARYRCHVCCNDFSDVRGTVFFCVKPVPLARWAYLVLLGDPGRLDGLTERELRRCWELARKIKTAQLVSDWREQLEAAGITAEQLRQHLGRKRRAA